jgi:hypothetical protein
MKEQAMNHRRLGYAFLGLFFLSSSVGTVSAYDPGAAPAYTSKDKEFYLSTEALAFVRPGLEITILDVTIPADLKAEVLFSLTDPAGLGLDLSGVTTPGPVSTSFILAYIPAGEDSYVAYTTRVQTSPITGDSAVQATTDSGGTYTDMGDGTYMYKFGTAVPADYDMTATHTLGMYGRRDLTEFELNLYVDNVVEHFIPSGEGTPMPRDIVNTETCNGRCHDPLAIHGGQRTDIEVCILCHNDSQDIDPDTGNSVDMPLMTHKIHMGAQLANGYTIIGYRQGVNDYSNVVYPGEINDCESCHTGGTPTEDFPLVSTPAQVLSCDGTGRGATTFTWDYDKPIQIRLAANDRLVAGGGPSGSVTTGDWVRDGMEFVMVEKDSGELVQELVLNTTVLGCAGNAPGTFRGEPGMNHTAWLVNPTAENCGSCHDDVNFVTGENHSPFNIPAPDDSECALCHKPSGGEFDRSIRGAHTVEYQSNQLPGVFVDVQDITSAAPGEFPRVTFKVSDKNGFIDPNALNRLRFTITGPNEDFSYYVQEDALGALTSLGGNLWAYDFETPIPDDAMGSYSFSFEGRNIIELNIGGGVTEDVRDQAENYLTAFAVTDMTAMPRRTITLDENCESCHLNLSFHGDNRHEPAYCSTCHSPQALDRGGEQNIGMKYMIHKIHMGTESATGGYVFDGDVIGAEYTGNLANCEGCHAPGTYSLPLPAGVLASNTPLDFLANMEPETAACLSCHDDLSSAVHADANTTMIGESCSTCHGTGKEFSVERVHAQ